MRRTSTRPPTRARKEKQGKNDNKKGNKKQKTNTKKYSLGGDQETRREPMNKKGKRVHGHIDISINSNIDITINADIHY